MIKNLFFSLLIASGPVAVIFSFMEIAGIFNENYVGVIVVYLTCLFFLFISFKILGINFEENFDNKKISNKH